jgi:hypothetical protein
LCALSLLLASGCASFNHQWKAAAKESVPSNDLEGRWKGVWASQVDHHTDELRCIVTRKEDGTYRARFHAKYHKVFTFGYTVPLHAQPGTNGYQFNGSANLSWLAGGMYHYEGHADGTNFWSTYSCKYDHGTFQMARP